MMNDELTAAAGKVQRKAREKRAPKARGITNYDFSLILHSSLGKAQTRYYIIINNKSKSNCTNGIVFEVIFIEIF